MYSDGLDSRGQAYSVFKLLIAAMVAVAILLVLMPIIASVMGLIKTDPGKAITDKLNNLLDRPGQLDHTGDVTFSPNQMIPGSAVTEKLPISRDQVCFALGDVEGSEKGFAVTTSSREPIEQRLSYSGTTERQVNIAVMCHYDKEELVAALDDSPGFEDAASEIDSDCVCPETGDCCAIVLERT